MREQTCWPRAPWKSGMGRGWVGDREVQAGTGPSPRTVLWPQINATTVPTHIWHLCAPVQCPVPPRLGHIISPRTSLTTIHRWRAFCQLFSQSFNLPPFLLALQLQSSRSALPPTDSFSSQHNPSQAGPPGSAASEVPSPPRPSSTLV